MKQEDTKYYTLNDIINTALQKSSMIQNKKDISKDVEFSLNVISDLTYSNIWNSFIKWCTDQTELGNIVNVFSFGNMFYVSEKQNEGISVKLTDFFLREHNLKWDETKSTYESLYRAKYENTKPQTEKLNYIYISTNLNTKKILVQNGLNNLFSSIGYLFESTPNCLLDLGNLGQFICNNRVVYQIPSSLKEGERQQEQCGESAAVCPRLRQCGCWQTSRRFRSDRHSWFHDLQYSLCSYVLWYLLRRRKQRQSGCL